MTHSFSLDCSYYSKTFETLQQLLDNILVSGMDPNYEITVDGLGLGETAADWLLDQA